MIGRADVSGRRHDRADARHRLQPLRHDRARRIVAFHVEAADRRVAVVEIEVDGELVARGLVLVAGEMLLRHRPSIRAGPVLRPPTARREWCGAGRMLSALQDAHRLHHRGAPSALSVAPVAVCHESRCAPTITISSLTRCRCREFRRSRCAVLRSSSLKRRLDLDRELHRDLLLQHPRDQVVVLGGEDDRRAPRWRPCRGR